MATVNACKCDICNKVFEYGIIQLRGKINYQRDKKKN